MTTATAGLTHPVRQMLQALAERPEVVALKDAVRSAERLVVEGVLRPARGPVWAALGNFQDKPRPEPTLWVTPSSDGAEVLVEDLRALGLDDRVVYFPFREERTQAEDARPVDPMQLAALEKLQSAGGKEPLLVVAPIRSLLQKTMSRQALEQSRWTVKQGEMTDRDTLLEMLV